LPVALVMTAPCCIFMLDLEASRMPTAIMRSRALFCMFLGVLCAVYRMCLSRISDAGWRRCKNAPGNRTHVQGCIYMTAALLITYSARPISGTTWKPMVPQSLRSFPNLLLILDSRNLSHFLKTSADFRFPDLYDSPILWPLDLFNLTMPRFSLNPYSATPISGTTW